MARYALSSIYYYRQEYELATPQIDRAIKINPLASDGCLMVVGTAEYPMGRYDAALKAFGALREAGSRSDAGRSRWPSRAARGCQGTGSRRNSAPSASSVSK